MKKIFVVLVLLLSNILLPNLAFAHVDGSSGGFWSGLNHPVLGLDHLLAMVSVGIVSAQIGGRAIWSVPATFVAVMLVGGVMGMQSIPLISVELGIAISVLALGIVIAADKRIAAQWAMLFVAVFAVFHGHAHGEEMPNLANPVLYALGFVSGTAAIHIAGVVIGTAAKKHQYGIKLMRMAGTAIAAVGIYFIVA